MLAIYRFFSHLNRKTSRIFSLNRIPIRCVLVLKSACCNSSTVGLASDLPNSDDTPAARKPRKEPFFVRRRICVIRSSFSLLRMIYDRLPLDNPFKGDQKLLTSSTNHLRLAEQLVPVQDLNLLIVVSLNGIKPSFGSPARLILAGQEP